METLLELKDLKIQFNAPGGVVTAVDEISYKINCGETLCVVGESGCGKSATALSILHLLADNGIYAGGSIYFKGRDLLSLSAKERRGISGHEISMIFQEPMTSLNPVHQVGKQIAESFVLHSHDSKKSAWRKAVHMLEIVGVPDAERIAKCYPHQLSGGMRQRVMIAMALACRPDLLIADEPTTALDVTVQAQILRLIKRLQSEMGMAVMFITHDLGVVAEIADYIVVMYAGKIVEEGTAEDIFYHACHPYTQGLLNCIPRVDEDREVLNVISGNVPNPENFPEGCRFHTRCSYCQQKCVAEMPKLRKTDDGIYACHYMPAERVRRSDEYDRETAVASN